MRQDRLAICSVCGADVIVTRRDAFTFDWRCDRCRSAGVIAWALDGPVPEFDGETQPSLFGETG